MWEVLGCLGASVDDLGPLSGPMLAVVGCSWGLVGSWAALDSSVGGPGASVGSPGPLLAEKWLWLKHESDPKGSGPLEVSEVPEPPEAT